jgi:uncharacterized membrane protein YqjE
MPDNGRSFASVISDIASDVQQIVRAEVRLARVELREELSKFKQGAVLMAAGAIALLMAVGVALLAAVWALALVWPLWAAALGVAAAVALLGVTLAMSGAGRIRSVHLPPQRTVETVRENIQWAKTRAR